MASVTPDVRIFEDLDALSNAAAVSVIEASAQAVRDRGRFLLCLSGGNTPLKSYELLAQTPYRDQVDWPHLHAFWGDERCVPPEDLENNYRQARDVLLGHVPTPTANIHRIRSELEPAAAAADYTLLLKQYAEPPLEWPRFDLVLLGMGDDGHTASLFPGSAPGAEGAVIAVMGHYQDRPVWRVTLTPAVFDSARQVAFLISGRSKSSALAKVLHGEYQPEDLPAQRIRPTDGLLIWLVDQDAASLI
jgi:6-phosphogluconolactonase